jgi:hypothetical protein
MAQIAQSRQLTKSALATQKASEVFDQGIPAKAAPAQKLALRSQFLSSWEVRRLTDTCTDLNSSYFSTFHCRMSGIRTLLSPRAARISFRGFHV